MAYLDFKLSWLDKPTCYDYQYGGLIFYKAPYCLILKSIDSIEECNKLSKFLFKSQQIVRIQHIRKELLECLQTENQICMYDIHNPRQSFMVLADRYTINDYFNGNYQFAATYSDESMYHLINPFFKDTNGTISLLQLENQLNLIYFSKSGTQTEFNETWLNNLATGVEDYQLLVNQITIAKLYGGYVNNITKFHKLRIVETIFYWYEENDIIIGGVKLFNCSHGLVIDIIGTNKNFSLTELYEFIVNDMDKPLRMLNHILTFNNDYSVGTYNLVNSGNSFSLDNKNSFDYQIIMKGNMMQCDVESIFNYQKAIKNTPGIPLTDFWHEEEKNKRNRYYYDRFNFV